MKKLSLFTVILIFCCVSAFSQPCLPEGITFTTQAQIDSFQINYPGCVFIEGDVSIGTWKSNDDIKNLDGLSVLRTVGGGLAISGNDSLMSLQGLEQLSLIGGGLSISHNDGLLSLTGLENAKPSEDLYIANNDELVDISALANLTSVRGDLDIKGNGLLPALTGLDNITSIEGSLSIGTWWVNATPGNIVGCAGNSSLTNIAALSNLGTVGGDISICCNDLLSDLSGLSNVDSIGGSLDIGYALDNDPGNNAGNPLLNDLTGLESLTFIDGDIRIMGNNSLTSLTGIENIDAASIQNIEISFNSSLSSCEVQSICDYLAAPNGNTIIQVNASGCNSPGEVANACGFPMPCLPFGNYYFYSQSDIDNFSTYYPGCTVLEGTVLIHGEDITNLNGLSEVTAFGGTLEIAGNDSLGGLTGLNNVTSIGEDLIIGINDLWPGWGIGGNQKLINLSGLNNLDSIGRGLKINSNEQLSNLSGLDNLSYIGRGVKINNNESLMSLTGLENLTSIPWYLSISGNGLISLEGLDNLSSIGWSLTIVGHDDSISGNGLISLEGLDNLSSIGWWLRIDHNDDLLSVTGLENLVSIGVGLTVSDNASLASLSGLDNVISIGGVLRIKDNGALTSLEGLDNIDPYSITKINISKNPSLSTCDVQSICLFLDIPGAEANIELNATGCQNIEQVQDSCNANGVFIDEQYIKDNLLFYPNPANQELNISIKGYSIDRVTVFTLTGQQILLERPVGGTVDISHLHPGMYIVEVTIENTRHRQKLLVQR